MLWTSDLWQPARKATQYLSQQHEQDAQHNPLRAGTIDPSNRIESNQISPALPYQVYLRSTRANGVISSSPDPSTEASVPRQHTRSPQYTKHARPNTPKGVQHLLSHYRTGKIRSTPMSSFFTPDVKDMSWGRGCLENSRLIVQLIPPHHPSSQLSADLQICRFEFAFLFSLFHVDDPYQNSPIHPPNRLNQPTQPTDSPTPEHWRLLLSQMYLLYLRSNGRSNGERANKKKKTRSTKVIQNLRKEKT